MEFMCAVGDMGDTHLNWMKYKDISKDTAQDYKEPNGVFDTYSCQKPRFIPLDKWRITTETKDYKRVRQFGIVIHNKML